jgi:hypothetical protein
MTTIQGFLDNLPESSKQKALNAIYEKLGPELANEIQNSTCEFVFDIDNRKSHFINCPPEIDKKIADKRNGRF